MEDVLVKATAGDARIYAVTTTHLTQYMNEIHHCTPLAAAALGRTTAGALLLAATMKAGEAVTVRFKGDGPLGQVMADARDYQVRGFVKHPEVMLPPKNGKLDVGGGVGHYGVVTVTRCPLQGEPFTGVSTLKSGEIAADLTRYLAVSEQTPSSVALGVLIEKDGSVAVSGGYFVQLLPDASEETIKTLEDNILTLPYVFTSEDHYWNFVESDLAKEMLAESKEVGLPFNGLAYGEEGFRHFFSKVEIHTIDDLKGLKIRVSDDPIMTGMVKGLGAAFTPVSFGELYTSLQTGVVDAAEQPITNYLSNSFQEVAPYLLKDGHTLGTIELIATDNCLSKLSDEQKAMVQEAADYAMQVCKESVTEKQEEAAKTLVEKGCTIIEVEDKTPWQEATKSVLEENIAGMEDIYEQIMALQ